MSRLNLNNKRQHSSNMTSETDSALIINNQIYFTLKKEKS